VVVDPGEPVARARRNDDDVSRWLRLARVDLAGISNIFNKHKQKVTRVSCNTDILLKLTGIGEFFLGVASDSLFSRRPDRD